MKLFHSAREALNSIGMASPAGAESVEKLYPVLVSDYYLSLIDPDKGSADPVYRQCIPDTAELSDRDSGLDPLAEEEQMPVPRVIHRFRDRVVLLVNSRCAVRCRFCFRKRTWTSGEKDLPDISDGELAQAAEYLASDSDIREVLISGGDPLMLPPERLRKVINTVEAIPGIDIIRVASRLPAVAPALITERIIDMLSPVDGLWLATHFNHPAEITAESAAALQKFVKAGIPVINQTVLLKGINDNAEILEELFRKLVSLKVKPHYLFHVDPVRGVRHFATGIDCGLEILRQFRSRLSSLAVPAFAIDLPEGGGKVQLQPDYRKEGESDVFPDIHNRKWIKYTLRDGLSGIE